MDATIIFKNEVQKKTITHVYKIEYLRSDLFGLAINIVQIFYVIPQHLKDGRLYDTKPKIETYKMDNIELLEVN